MNTARPHKIYVASSWRNELQPMVVDVLRSSGHEVYDFRNPAPGNFGFSWSEIDPDWKSWTPEEYRDALTHPIAERGFSLDFGAMQWADTFVCVLPCGRSAHLELGWAAGQGKKTIVFLQDMEPELMAKMCDHLCVSLEEVLAALEAEPVGKPDEAVLADYRALGPR